MQNIWINAEKCTSCGQCVDVCPHRCLSINPTVKNSFSLSPAYLRNSKRCSGCESCVYICPVGAIEGYKL